MARFNMWSFARHGQRRFKNDARYDLQNVTTGFASHLDDSSDDTKLLQRICTAYIKAVEQQQSASVSYQPTAWWERVRRESLGPVRQALLTRDAVALQKMYQNFFRDSCSTGLLGVPYGRSKAYFGDAIKDVHRHFYLSHVLYRIDYWMAQTQERFKLCDLTGPPFGNPFGVQLGETFVRVGAEYAHYCAHRIARTLDSETSIVAEIGGGFGGMAFYLLRDQPNVTYLDFDTPESVALTSYYLMKSFPNKRFFLYGEEQLSKDSIERSDILLLPLFELDTLPSNSVNVTFSSHSMSDLSVEAMDIYLNNISRMTRDFFLSIGNSASTESISDLVSKKYDSFSLVETLSSGWHSHKVSGAGVGGAAGLAASAMFEQSYQQTSILKPAPAELSYRT